VHGALEAYHTAKKTDLNSLLEALEDRWNHAGFSTPQEQLEYHARAEAILKTYWEAESRSGARIVCVERGFLFPMGSHRVRGKIDRVDQREDGSYEIIDYKSHSNVATEEQTAQDLQLRIYGLAAKECMGIEPRWISFYYVAEGKKVSAAYPAQKEGELLAILLSAADEISREADPVPNTQHCTQCPFKKRCPKSEAEHFGPFCGYV
jgi:RecB family exonuclease